MRSLQWQTPLAVTAAASILGTLLLPGSALASDHADTMPTIVDVSPRAVATADFVTENNAVTVTAAGFLPGEEVRLDIASTPRAIETIHDRRRARADGTVTFPIGGSPGRPANSYSGGYQAEITSDHSLNKGYLSESFSVLPVVPADDGTTSAGTDRASSPVGSIGLRAKNGIQDPPDQEFSVAGVGLSTLTLVFAFAATTVVTRRSQKPVTDDRQ